MAGLAADGNGAVEVAQRGVGVAALPVDDGQRVVVARDLLVFHPQPCQQPGLAAGELRGGLAVAALVDVQRRELPARIDGGAVLRPLQVERERQRLAAVFLGAADVALRSEEHTSELQSLMRNSYAVFCLKKKITYNHTSVKHKIISI